LRNAVNRLPELEKRERRVDVAPDVAPHPFVSTQRKLELEERPIGRLRRTGAHPLDKRRCGTQSRISGSQPRQTAIGATHSGWCRGGRTSGYFYSPG